jgi:hypothetical protein
MPPSHGLRSLLLRPIRVLEQLPLLFLVFCRCFSLLPIFSLLRLRLSFLLRSPVFLECFLLFLRFLLGLARIVCEAYASSASRRQRSTQNNQQRENSNSFHADFPFHYLRFPLFIINLSACRGRLGVPC